MARRAPARGKGTERTRLLAAAALALAAVVLTAVLLVALDVQPGERAGGSDPGTGGGSGGGTGRGSGGGSGDGNGPGSGDTVDLETREQQQHDCTIANWFGGGLAVIAVLIVGHGIVTRASRRDLMYRGLAALLIAGLGGVMVWSCQYEPTPSEEPLPEPNSGGGGGGGSSGDGTSDRNGERPVTTPPTPPDIPWLLIGIILGVIILAVVGYFLLKSLKDRAPGDLDPLEEAQALSDVSALMRAAQGAAAGTADTREAVVAAYAKFLAACALLGAPRMAFETPREHGATAPERTGLPPEAVRAIVEAYEMVRYAERDPPPEARDRALEGLTAILAHAESKNQEAVVLRG